MLPERPLRPQDGDAVRQRPGGSRESAGVFVLVPPGLLAADDVCVEKTERRVAGGVVVGIVDACQAGPEHHFDVAGVAVGEVGVGACQGAELGDRVSRALGECVRQMLDEQREAVGRDGGEQPGLVAEVVGGRSVRHPAAAGDVAKAQGVGAALVERGRGRVEQCTAQIADEVLADAARLGPFAP